MTTTTRKARRAALTEAPAEAPTTAEMYLRARRTSHLEMRETRGDVDRVIAAGLSSGRPSDPPQTRLGMMLFELIGEYQELDRTVKVSMARRGKPEGSPARGLFTLLDMGSLRETKATLAEYSDRLCAKFGYSLSEQAMAAVISRCVQAFLDPLCNTCHGARVTGTYGAPQPICESCGGTGKVDTQIGKDATERQFAGRLLRDMESFATEAERHARLNLKAVDAAKMLIIEQARAE